MSDGLNSRPLPSREADCQGAYKSVSGSAGQGSAGQDTGCRHRAGGNTAAKLRGLGSPIGLGPIFSQPPLCLLLKVTPSLKILVSTSGK